MGVWQDYRKAGSLELPVLGLMAAESVAYALAFGMVTSMLTGLLLPGLASIGRAPDLAVGSRRDLEPANAADDLPGRWDLRGAALPGDPGVGARLDGTEGLRLGHGGSAAFAVAVGALIFSAFHYIGPYGDRLELGSFAFRAVAGVLFSGLYLLRGLGITAWTHACTMCSCRWQGSG